MQNAPTEHLTETEAYYEYSIDGKLKKDTPQYGRIKSRYPEDVFANDHTSVWGSWWNQYLGWGYQCCHSNTKQSMCMGLKGKELALQREFKVKKQRMKEELEVKAAAATNEEPATELRSEQQN